MTNTHAVTVELLGNMALRAITESGHEVIMDAAPEVGGTDTGPRPMELLLVGLGGCTGMDVVSMLRKMRQDVTAYEVHVSGERASEHPKIYTSIHVEHVVHGCGLNPESVRRAVELSATRYCSAAAMLGRVAHIEERYRLVDDASGQEQTGVLAAAA
ncbi:MAG TPA: OsmC family protein [Ktedonobacterales bacterium]|nr:OsmC family protein [Ktedonobacterales bacterium]